MAGRKGSSTKKAPTKSSSGNYRSAKSGRYVSEKYGKTHPSTTVKETKKK